MFRIFYKIILLHAAMVDMPSYNSTCQHYYISVKQAPPAFTHFCGRAESLSKALRTGDSGGGGWGRYAGGEGRYHRAARPFDAC